MRAILFALVLCACAAQAPLRLTAPENATATPYESLAAQRGEVMRAADYVEQEYFLSGHANIYRTGEDGRAEVQTADVAYTTRLLIARPRDGTRFSGRVFVAPAHPARGQTFWPSVRDYVLREGDVFVSVFIGSDERSRALTETSGAAADALSLMRAYGEGRYDAIVWPRDDGIRWDVFGQTVQLLRSDDRANPLRDLMVQRVYAIGWSFTGSYLRTYINEGFHERYRLAGGAPAIDGYLIGISQHDFRSGYLAINSSAPEVAAGDVRREPRAIDVPVIELMTENEAITKAPGPLPEERDAGMGRRRTYEVAGVTHGDGLGDAPAPSECPFPESDIPFRYLAWAALDNLDLWVRTGIAPPRQAAPMARDGERARVDVYGNAVGGVEIAQIALPLARYGEVQSAACAPRAPHYLAVRRVPLGRDVLATLYPGGEAEYLGRFEAQIDRMIAARWFLAEDKPAVMESARAAAAAAFR